MENQTATQWITQGREHQSRQDWAEAVYCYNKALELEPEGEAKAALEMINGILAFGNREIYNV